MSCAVAKCSGDDSWRHNIALGMMVRQTLRKLLAAVAVSAYNIAFQTVALGDALYIYSQLLYDEDLVVVEGKDFVVSNSDPLARDRNNLILRCRRRDDVKGLYSLVLQTTRGESVADLQLQVALRDMIFLVRGLPCVLQYAAVEVQTHTGITAQLRELESGPVAEPCTLRVVKERLQGACSLQQSIDNAERLDLPASVRQDMAKQVTKQLLTALAGLHSRGVAARHLDSTSAHVLATKSDSGTRTWTTTFTDIDSLQHFEQDRPAFGDSLHFDGIDIRYAAPEIYHQSQQRSAKGFSVSAPAANLWAVGIIMFQIATRHLPFSSNGSADAKSISKRHNAWAAVLTARGKQEHPMLIALDGLPSEMAALIVALLRPDPQRRITAEAALDHGAMTL